VNIRLVQLRDTVLRSSDSLPCQSSKDKMSKLHVLPVNMSSVCHAGDTAYEMISDNPNSAN